ncbi:MAG: hypothetical protein MUP63_01275 [Candidatus Nanohaloarchaeota archaeon QJJ-7]|nr:hypothetical protein [Candidatus Nanohaloarchaeota archaeon QJJ-7]
MATDTSSYEEGRDSFISAMESYGAFFLDGESGNYRPVEELEDGAISSIRAVIDYQGNVEIPAQDPERKYEERMGEADITGRMDFRYDPADTSPIEMKLIYPWHYPDKEITNIIEDLETSSDVQVQVDGDVKARFMGSPEISDPEKVAVAADMMVENGQEIIDRLARESVRKFFD